MHTFKMSEWVSCQTALICPLQVCGLSVLTDLSLGLSSEPPLESLSAHRLSAGTLAAVMTSFRGNAWLIHCCEAAEHFLSQSASYCERHILHADYQTELPLGSGRAETTSRLISWDTKFDNREIVWVTFQRKIPKSGFLNMKMCCFSLHLIVNKISLFYSVSRTKSEDAIVTLGLTFFFMFCDSSWKQTPSSSVTLNLLRCPAGPRADWQLAGGREHRRRRGGKSRRHCEGTHRHSGGYKDGAGCQGTIDGRRTEPHKTLSLCVCVWFYLSKEIYFLNETPDSVSQQTSLLRAVGFLLPEEKNWYCSQLKGSIFFLNTIYLKFVTILQILDSVFDLNLFCFFQHLRLRLCSTSKDQNLLIGNQNHHIFWCLLLQTNVWDHLFLSEIMKSGLVTQFVTWTDWFCLFPVCFVWIGL